MENPFETIVQHLVHIENMLSQLLSRPQVVTKVPERPISVKEAASLLNVSPSGIYKNIDVIPHYKRLGKHYFFENELIAYLKGETLANMKPPKTIQQPRPPRKRRTSIE